MRTKQEPHVSGSLRTYPGPADLAPLIRHRTPRRVRISQLAAERLRLIGIGESPDTRSVYRRILAMFGHRFADDLAAHPEELEAWEELQRDGEGLARGTIAKHTCFVSTLFKHAIETGAAPSNPVRAMTRKITSRVKDRGKAKLEVLTPDEVRLVCSAAHIPWWRRFAWRFLLLTGVREGEAIGAQHRDYVPPSGRRCGEILVARQWSAKRRRYDETKTEEVRHVPAHGSLVTTYAWALARLRLQTGSEPDPTAPLLPYFRPGHPETPLRWDARTILRWWHKDLASCGIPSPAAGPRRLHATRHTFITTLYRAGAPEPLIRSMTHADSEARDAFRRYVHTEWADMAKAIARLPFDKEVRHAS